MCEHSNNPYFTDTAMFKYWSKEMICGGGALHAGSCNEIGECVCRNGYTHDLSNSRFRTCNLYSQVLPIWFGMQFSMSFAVFYITLKSFREAKSIARLTLLINLICLVIHMLYCVLQFAFDYKTNVYIFGSLYLTISCISASFCLVSYSLMSPLLIAAHRSKFSLRSAIFAFFVTFRFIELVPFLIAVILYDDVNNATKDNGWNYMNQTYTFLVACENIVHAFVLIFQGNTMIRHIRELSEELDGVGETRARLTRAYVQKLQKMIQRIKLLLVPLLFTLYIVPTMQFITNYVPFNYIFATGAVSTIPLFIYSLTKYAAKTPQTDTLSSSSSPDKTKSPQTVNVLIQQRSSSSLENPDKSDEVKHKLSSKFASFGSFYKSFPKL